MLGLFGVFFVLVFCAFLCAWFSGRQSEKVQPEVLEDEKNSYGDKWFFETENFYRNFLVNLSFSGITLSVVGSQSNDLLDWHSPLFWVVVNLMAIVFAVSEIKNTEDCIKEDRKNRITLIMTVGIFIFAASYGAACFRQCNNSSGSTVPSTVKLDVKPNAKSKESSPPDGLLGD